MKKVIKCSVVYYYIPFKESYDNDVKTIENAFEIEKDQDVLFDITIENGNFNVEITEISDEEFKKIKYYESEGYLQ